MTDTASLVLVANAGDGSISTFRLTPGSSDGASAGLDRLAVTEGLTGCSTFVVDAARDLVYAGVKGEPAGIVALTLDRASGILTPVSRLDLPGGGMNYLALTRDGSGLLGVSYGGGYGISCPVADGVVGEPVSRVTYPNLHSVLPSPDGRFAYLVSLGADLIAQYALADDLSLTPLDPPTVAAPAGSGPRHLVVDDAHDAVYVMTEFSGEVLHYRRDRADGSLGFAGAATAIDASAGLGRSVFGADPLAHHYIWGADLHLAGDRLWASERTESMLGSLAIAADGTPTDAEAFTRTETQPRGFDVSPDGRFLVAAGEKSTTVSLYAVIGDHLELRQRAETGRGANWVRFV
ncbi:MAG: beta-propeller fold lactonase family protein [Microbacterium sp.]|uniref:lactonase family protein n=1 Tax=Microbacterium sp. TaxID=51671 RepID=UPI001AC74520|nr:beta-propeller fold lactonase family protein [Microbacterium sp.]MBN9177914.1 beta-propeller fold lactonase family protein [Microbacterium sp.]